MIWDTLEIKPTTDLNVIKSAYVRLAKQYNPEEHPDEFKHIHDAYISACNYVKIRKMNSSSKGNNVPLQNENKKNMPEENSGLNFSGVNPNNKHSKSKETPNINNNLDFSSVNQSNENRPCDNTANANNNIYLEYNYDFNNIQAELHESSIPLTESERRKKLLLKMKKAIADMGTDENKNIILWNYFFKQEDFECFILDKEFRKYASDLVFNILFSPIIATLIAEEFGWGSKASPETFNSSEKWKVQITVGNSKTLSNAYRPNYTPDFLCQIVDKKLVMIIFFIMIIIVIIVVSAYIFLW